MWDGKPHWFRLLWFDCPIMAPDEQGSLWQKLRLVSWRIFFGYAWFWVFQQLQPPRLWHVAQWWRSRFEGLGRMWEPSRAGEWQFVLCPDKHHHWFGHHTGWLGSFGRLDTCSMLCLQRRGVCCVCFLWPTSVHRVHFADIPCGVEALWIYLRAQFWGGNNHYHDYQNSPHVVFQSFKAFCGQLDIEILYIVENHSEPIWTVAAFAVAEVLLLDYIGEDLQLRTGEVLKTHIALFGMVELSFGIPFVCELVLPLEGVFGMYLDFNGSGTLAQPYQVMESLATFNNEITISWSVVIQVSFRPELALLGFEFNFPISTKFQVKLSDHQL